MMRLLLYLLSPDTPIWVKVGVTMLAIAIVVISIVAWWKQDYWQSLQTPDEKSDKRQARPPF